MSYGSYSTAMRATQDHPAKSARAVGLGALAAACAILLLVLVGGPVASADPGATASKSVRVKIRSFKFKPPTLRISRGDRVVWVNRDRALHTATRRGSFDTGVIPAGKAVSVRFKRRGTYRYICTLHPVMRGKVIVR